MSRRIVFQPIRDTQQDEPVCLCAQCGGEIYAGSVCYVLREQAYCEDCVEKTTGREYQELRWSWI